MIVIHTPFHLWILATFVLIFFEMGAPGLFYFLSLACGTLSAAILASLGFSLTLQWVGLLGVSVVSLLLLRQWVSRLPVYQKNETNVYALVGKSAVVTKEIIPPKTGRIKVAGEQWVAQSGDNHHLKVGSVVVIKNVTGIRLIVEKKHNPHTEKGSS